MKKFEGPLRTLVTVVLALATNVVVDVAFDLPMLARWAIVVTVVLLVTLLLGALRRRVDAEATDRNRA